MSGKASTPGPAAIWLSPRPSPSPSLPPPSPPAALAPLLVLRLQHKPLTLSSPRMATQRTPSLLPGQIHSLSDLATSLFYSSLSSSSLPKIHSLIQHFTASKVSQLTIHPQSSHRQAGQGLVPPSWEGGRVPSCQAPTSRGPHFSAEERESNPFLPLSFLPALWGNSRKLGSHAPSAVQYCKASSSRSPR